MPPELDPEQAQYNNHLESNHGIYYDPGDFDTGRIPPVSFLRRIHDMEHDPRNPHAQRRMNPPHEHGGGPTNWRRVERESPDAMRWSPEEGDEEMGRWESLFHDRRREGRRG